MTADADRRRVGPDTHELQPLWMRSEQVAGVASTVPGFQTVLLIAYLKPGSIKAVTKALNRAIEVGTLLTPSGHVYHFDKYYTTETAVVYQTTLDNQSDDPETVIDTVDTIFDEVDGDVVKYLN
ncbi:MAG: hypothetical protein EON55_13030 [Alphaproteobacteria bacterium]|nr:MAG: hypothetical protein EON55_13030 [Alphaproteobacteria bacterium]